MGSFFGIRSSDPNTSVTSNAGLHNQDGSTVTSRQRRWNTSHASRGKKRKTRAREENSPRPSQAARHYQNQTSLRMEHPARRRQARALGGDNLVHGGHAHLEVRDPCGDYVGLRKPISHSEIGGGYTQSGILFRCWLQLSRLQRWGREKGQSSHGTKSRLFLPELVDLGTSLRTKSTFPRCPVSPRPSRREESHHHLISPAFWIP